MLTDGTAIDDSDAELLGQTAAPSSKHQFAARYFMPGALLVLLVASADYGYHWWTAGRFIESTDDAYVGGDITQIAPRIAGFIQAVLVEDHQYVDAGQLILRIDPSDFAAALNHAVAALASKRATLSSLRAKQALYTANIVAAEAELKAKRAQAAFATSDASRFRALARSQADTSQNEERTATGYRTARAAVSGAEAALEAAGRQLDVIKAETEAAAADVAQAEADVQTAKLNLSYTNIKAPVSGYIGNRSGQNGAYVASGANLLSIVPAHGLWIDANFKEDQLALMKPGQPVTVVADILPGRIFHGHVASLSPATGAVFSIIPPQNATGNFTKIVQRVPVRITLDEDGRQLGLLRAGLSVTARVDTMHISGSSP